MHVCKTFCLSVYLSLFLCSVLAPVCDPCPLRTLHPQRARSFFGRQSVYLRACISVFFVLDAPVPTPTPFPLSRAPSFTSELAVVGFFLFFHAGTASHGVLDLARC